MGKFGPISWKKFDAFLVKVGCQFIREKGDHRIYRRADLQRPLVVPRYSAIPMFIIRNNLRVLGIDVESYLEMIEKI